MYQLQKDFCESGELKRPRNSVSCRRMRVAENKGLNLRLWPKGGCQKLGWLQTVKDGKVDYHYSRKYETFLALNFLKKLLANRPCGAEHEDLRTKKSVRWIMESIYRKWQLGGYTTGFPKHIRAVL